MEQINVGDVVQHFLTEQLGIVIAIGAAGYKIVWTTKGQSLFGPGNTEWCSWKSLEVISASR